MRKSKVAVSDIGIMEKLATQDFLARNMLLRKTQDIDFHPFEEFGIDLPETISSVKNIDGKRFGIERELKRLWLLEEKIINSLSLVYPEIDFFFDLARCAGIGYYDGFCIKITAENREGKRYPLIDGGASNWMKKLASNNKEQLFVSGMGTELFARFFWLWEIPKPFFLKNFTNEKKISIRIKDCRRSIGNCNNGINMSDINAGKNGIVVIFCVTHDNGFEQI